MTSKKRDFYSTWPRVLLATFISGICWWMSFNLNGDYGWMLWIAPVPVLLIAYHASARKAFFAAFVGYLIGRLSWLPYLLSVAPVFLSIAFTLIFPLLFTLVVMASRFVLRRLTHWTAVLAFPVFFTAYEYLLFIFSHDGTMGSIAYSVTNCLPLLQIASLTGILGITFMLCFVPSAIAGWIFLSVHSKPRRTILVVTIVAVLAVAAFGFWRIYDYHEDGFLRSGMTVIDEKLHWQKDSAGVSGNVLVARQYASQIPSLVLHGATLILLPENIVDATDDSVLKIFLATAKDQHVWILWGYRLKKDGKMQNRAMVISPGGEMLLDYQKKNLFEGEIMDGFVPGDGKPGIFSFQDITSGLAICKDMDFQSYISRYNINHPKIFFAPAWDFDQDDWMHSRMAILRGVENGYTVVRNARRGRLTISDYRGKVQYETSSSQDKAVSLIGRIPYADVKTFYAKTGDWFGIFNLLASAAFLFLAGYRKK